MANRMALGVLTPIWEGQWRLWGLAGAGVLSLALVLMPFMVGAMAIGGFCVICLVIAAYLWPVRVLEGSFFLLMLGNTMFRLRDEHATLEGVADTQVLFQLGVYGGVFMVAVVVMLTDRYPRSRLTFIEGLLGCVAAFLLVSASWSSIPTVTAVRAIEVAILVVFGVVAVRVLGPSRALTALFMSTVVYVLLCSLARLGTGYGYEKITKSGLVRFTWFYVHPIIAGTYACSAALYLIARGLYVEPGRRRGVWVRWFLTAVMLLVALATMSRGPVLAFIGGLGVLVFRRFARPWLTAVAIPILLAGIVSTLAVLPVATEWLGTGEASKSAAGAFLLRGESLEGLIMLNGRVELWQELTPLFVSRPLLGHGYLASRSFIMEYRPWASEAHNAMVQSLLDLGIVGTILLWVAVASIFLRVPRRLGAVPTQLSFTRALLLSQATFVLLNSVTTASFAGAPGFESMIALMCILAASATRQGDAR